MFTLYTTLLSANGRKTLAVCHHLGLEPAVEHVNVYLGEGRTPTYLAINPLGKIPTLVDGDLVLWESNAILQYVCDAYGEGHLWGQNAKERADISRWLFWESSHWQPVFVPILAELVGRRLRGLAVDGLEVSWQDEHFVTAAMFLDSHLQGKDFLVGDLSLADFSVAAMMMYVRDASFPVDQYSNIAAWHERVERLEAWKLTAYGPWA